MLITVPDYYKDFKCIAGACTDTCCAGWEVDVDEKKYNFYKTVKGNLGKRLNDVMIPKEDGGCSFRLTTDMRCPFLDEKGLCDIYKELGETALCETCTDFPRFIHEYGAGKEIGLAPSCLTAAYLMVNKKELTRLESSMDNDMNISLNDIDAELFFNLKTFREEVFGILKKDDLNTGVKLIMALDLAYEFEQKNFATVKENSASFEDKKDFAPLYFKAFEGMETINEKWSELAGLTIDFLKKNPDPDFRKKSAEELERKLPQSVRAFEELIFYYFYRYILESVYDKKLLGAIKTAVMSFICTRYISLAIYEERGGISIEEIADIFHLYSRHVEHSEINFAHYKGEYEKNVIYSLKALKKELY